MWESQPSNARALARGFTKKCPLCGGRGLFRKWFQLREFCPTCGFKFEREPGFFTGGWIINTAFGETLLAIELIAYVLALANNVHISASYVIAVAVPSMLISPLVFFPMSRTIWVAIELMGAKPTEQETADARERLDAQRLTNQKEP